MRCSPISRIITLVTFLTVCSSAAFSRQCTPAWDTTVGNPGVSVSSGYIGELRAFDDGSGEMLYAGGSFSSVVGVPSTSLIARWDRISQSWSTVGGGLNGSFVTSIVPFDAGGGPELVVGGVFQGAFGVPNTTNIARWNGSAWSSLAASLSGSVWAMTPWDDGGGERLYVGGSFPTAGGVTANGIAAWDGVQWHSLGAGITGSFSPYVGSMMVFDDGSGEKLYVGGRFDTMDGLNTPLIARWDGSTWGQVGSGLINDDILFGIESMAVYDDGSGSALYVGGNNFHAPGQPIGNVAKWDGQQWTTVGAKQTGRVTTLSTFDDGNGLGLYGGGNAMPNWKYFARLVSGQWQPVGGGVWNNPAPPWPSTFSLYVWGDALYVGGSYNLAGSQFPCGCIAAWGCQSVVVYCTAGQGTSSGGCFASISTSSMATGPVSGANDYDVIVAGVEDNKPGIIFYGYASATIPFSNGTLCIQPPLKRTPPQNTGGGVGCNGSMILRINDPAGVDHSSGTTAFFQGWNRDPASGVGTDVSDAVEVQYN